jgi:hypothetical protein
MCPDFLFKVGLVSETGNPGIEQQQELRPIDQEILNVRDSDPRLTQWEDMRDFFESWMEEARTIAVAGYRLVLDDGPEICSSDAYVGDMSDESGQPVLSRVVMTTEQAERLRNRGRAGGLVSVSGTGRQDI